MVNKVEKILKQIRITEEKSQQLILNKEKSSEKEIKKAKAKALTLIESGKEKIDNKIQEDFNSFVKNLNVKKKSRLRKFEQKANLISKNSLKNKDEALDFLYKKFMKKMV